MNGLARSARRRFSSGLKQAAFRARSLPPAEATWTVRVQRAVQPAVGSRFMCNGGTTRDQNSRVRVMPARKILVVEDQEEIREIIGLSLEQVDGWQVVFADPG